MGMRRGVWGDGENENACPNFFGRAGKRFRETENGTEWGCKSLFQKTEVSEKKRHSLGNGRGIESAGRSRAGKGVGNLQQSG